MNICKLEKESSTGKKLTWEAMINRNKVTYRFGQLGGKIQEEGHEYAEGKNIGRANETTPEYQCLFEAERKIRKQVEKGYRIINGYKFQTQSDTVLKQSTTAPKPMLAHEYKKHEEKVPDSGVWVQPKFDGLRGLLNIRTGELVSRNGKPIYGMEHIYDELKKIADKIPSSITWLDGELYAHGVDFSEITSTVRRTKNLKDNTELQKIKLHVFDAVLNETFDIRYQLLKNSLSALKFDYIQLADCWICRKNELDSMHDTVAAKGYEGIMIRVTNKPYEHKRSYSLLKFKKFQDEEFTICGFEKEEHADTLGALILTDKKKIKFNARPAIPQEEKDSIWKDQSNYMGKVVTVKFQGKSKDNIPRFPVVVGFRHEDDM